MERFYLNKFQGVVETAMAACLAALSVTSPAPIVHAPVPMPEQTRAGFYPSLSSRGSLDLSLYRVTEDPPIEPLLEPQTIEAKAAPEDPNIIEIPGQGKFKLTDNRQDGAGSVYGLNKQKEGKVIINCMGCSKNFEMADGTKLTDEVEGVAVDFRKFPKGSDVLLVTADKGKEDDPNNIRMRVFKARDTGGFVDKTHFRSDQDWKPVVVDVTTGGNHNLLAEDGSRGIGSAGVTLIGVLPTDPIPGSPSTSLPGWDGEAS